MFTGIIEETGRIQTITERKIVIKAKKVMENTKLGDSISVNGVCLTVTEINSDGFSADISPQTLKVTAFRNLSSGDYVNLERALPADGRFGGHVVSGHIDGTAIVKSISKSGEFYNLKIEVTDGEAKYIVKRGSITLNGISLTVADIEGKTVEFAIIPHTYENTMLKYLRAGDIINVETDIFAKYIEKFLSTRDNKTGIDMEFLMENGF